MGGSRPGGDDEDALMGLVQLAGERAQPSEERTARARAGFEAGWRAGVRRRRSRVLLLQAAAVLAAVALVVGVRQRLLPQPETAAVATRAGAIVARLDTAAGLVERETEAGWMAISAGEPLRVGSRVRTGLAGAGLLFDDGRSLRLAPGSRVLFEAEERLALEAGAVYVDSGRPNPAPSGFEVATPLGVVRETGTQFEVRLEPEALRVRVREGSVAVLSAGREEAAAAGTELRIDETGATRRPIPAHAAEWAWVLPLAPGFEMDGRSAHELLAWASREAGWRLRYVDDQARRRAESTTLRGSIRGVPPDQALVAVIPSTGMRHALEDGVLKVGGSAAR